MAIISIYIRIAYNLTSGSLRKILDLIASHTFKEKEKVEVKVYVIGEILVDGRRICSEVLPMGKSSSSLVPRKDGINLHLSKR